MNIFRREKITIDSSTFPLLGRAKEISEFEEFLGKAQLKRSAHKFMVIYGNARIGKTRLLAKLINIAEKQNVPSPDEAKVSNIVKLFGVYNSLVIFFKRKESSGLWTKI